MDNNVRLVGSIVEASSLKVIGYILYVEKTCDITIIDKRFLPSLLNMHDIINVIINDKGNIECTECSINNFPRYTVDDRGNINGCIDKNKMYVIGELLDDSNNVVGYRVMGASGKVLDISKDAISEQKCSNIDMVNVYVKGNTLVPNKSKKFSEIHTSKNNKKVEAPTQELNNFGNKVLKDNKIQFLHRIAKGTNSTVTFPFPQGSYYCCKNVDYAIEEPSKKLALKKLLNVVKTEVRAFCANNKERERFDQQMQLLSIDLKSKNIDTASLRLKFICSVLYNDKAFSEDFGANSYSGELYRFKKAIANYFKCSDENGILKGYATNLVVVSDKVYAKIKDEYDKNNSNRFYDKDQKYFYNNVELLDENRIVRSKNIPYDIRVIQYVYKNGILPKSVLDEAIEAAYSVKPSYLSPDDIPMIISPREIKRKDDTRIMFKLDKNNDLVSILERSVEAYYNTTYIVHKPNAPFLESTKVKDIGTVDRIKWDKILTNYIGYNFKPDSKFVDLRVIFIVKMMSLFNYDNLLVTINNLENRGLKDDVLNTGSFNEELFETIKQNILSEEEITYIKQNDLSALEFYYTTNGGVKISDNGKFLDIASFNPKSLKIRYNSDRIVNGKHIEDKINMKDILINNTSEYGQAYNNNITELLGQAGLLLNRNALDNIAGCLFNLRFIPNH